MQTNQPLTINRNYFSLARLQPNCYYPPIRVDFSSNPSFKSFSNSILPVYNHDSQFFTPTFLLPSEKSYFLSNSNSERLKFEEKLNAELFQGNDNKRQRLCQQLQSSDSKYCQICQMKFEDYWLHIGQMSHQRKMHLSQSNAHIKDLCLKFAIRNGDTTIEASMREPSPKRRGNRNANKIGLKHCISQQILKGNCSTQILGNGSEIAEI